MLQMHVSWLRLISMLVQIHLFPTRKDYFHFILLKLLKFFQHWPDHQVGLSATNAVKELENSINSQFQSNQDRYCWHWRGQILSRLRKFNLSENIFKIQFHWMFFIAIQSQTQRLVSQQVAVKIDWQKFLAKRWNILRLKSSKKLKLKRFKKNWKSSNTRTTGKFFKLHFWVAIFW